MEIECFLLTETETVRRSLRRFAYTTQRVCPAMNPLGCCDASVVIEPALLKPQEGEYETSPALELFKDDPRWPVACAHCGQPFAPEHQWQVNDHRLWTNVERDVLTTIRWDECPVGAMWLAGWCNSYGSLQWRERGGGPHLFVMTPGGLWDIDQGWGDEPCGNGWERTGDPPRVTASPSIRIADRYHGWLKYGKLIDA